MSEVPDFQCHMSPVFVDHCCIHLLIPSHVACLSAPLPFHPQPRLARASRKPLVLGLLSLLLLLSAGKELVDVDSNDSDGNKEDDAEDDHDTGVLGRPGRRTLGGGVHGLAGNKSSVNDSHCGRCLGFWGVETSTMMLCYEGIHMLANGAREKPA